MTPPLTGIDHVHLRVADRVAAVAWYRRVLGFEPIAEFIEWAQDGGPLTIADAAGSVHLALFELPPKVGAGVVAMRTDGAGFIAWREHLARELGQPPRVEDHRLALSMYFADPDGNPFEITTYEHDAARGR